jgi:hypothetical protein
LILNQCCPGDPRKILFRQHRPKADIALANEFIGVDRPGKALAPLFLSVDFGSECWSACVGGKTAGGIGSIASMLWPCQFECLRKGR